MSITNKTIKDGDAIDKKKEIRITNKTIQDGNVIDTAKGNKEFVVLEKHKHFLFQSSLPRMPEYKIIQLEPEKKPWYLDRYSHKSLDLSEVFKGRVDDEGNTLSLSEIFKEQIAELGYDPYASGEKEKERKDVSENFYIVDEVGELFEKAQGKDKALEDIELRKEFFELIKKVKYDDPLNLNILRKPNLFDDALCLDMENHQDILEFSKKYGMLYTETTYFSNQNNGDQQILLWDFVPENNATRWYEPGKLSLNGFRNTLSTYQNIAKLWVCCMTLDKTSDLKVNQRNVNNDVPKSQRPTKPRILEEIKTLKKLYDLEFGKLLEVPDKKSMVTVNNLCKDNSLSYKDLIKYLIMYNKITFMPKFDITAAQEKLFGHTRNYGEFGNDLEKDGKREPYKFEQNKIDEQDKIIYETIKDKKIIMIELPEDNNLTKEELRFGIEMVKVDIIKKINHSIYNVRPEIYLEEKDGITNYRYRFIYRDLIEALYLVLFNLVTDNGLRFFICRQCGKINAFTDGRGVPEYCFDFDKNSVKKKGSSKCKRQAEEERKGLKPKRKRILRGRKIVRQIVTISRSKIIRLKKI